MFPDNKNDGQTMVRYGNDVNEGMICTDVVDNPNKHYTSHRPGAQDLLHWVWPGPARRRRRYSKYR